MRNRNSLGIRICRKNDNELFLFIPKDESGTIGIYPKDLPSSFIPFVENIDKSIYKINLKKQKESFAFEITYSQPYKVRVFKITETQIIDLPEFPKSLK